MAVIIAWRTGKVEVSRHEQPGALTLLRGPGRPLRRAISVLARHAYDGASLLVPGVPEAGDDDVAALRAAKDFQERLRQHLAGAEARASS